MRAALREQGCCQVGMRRCLAGIRVYSCLKMSLRNGKILSVQCGDSQQMQGMKRWPLGKQYPPADGFRLRHFSGLQQLLSLQ